MQISTNYFVASYSMLKYKKISQVTGVGINTEWGLLMSSISEDNGEETPLQVKFVKIPGLLHGIHMAGYIVNIVVFF